MKIRWKIILLLIISVCSFAASAAPERPGKQPQGREKPARRRGTRQRNSDIWRAFSMLPNAEQRQLLRLQRNDPEKFRTIMQQKAAELHAAQQAKRKKVRELATQIRNCKDEKQKAELMKQLREMVKADYEQRLAYLRRNIEANKRRLAAMEKELKKREENSDAVINAITKSIVSGETPNRHPGGRRAPRGDAPRAPHPEKH